MPDMVCVNLGKEKIQYWALGTDGSDLEDFYVLLFSNDYDIIDTTILADLTEAAFPGYASFDVPRDSFGAPALVGNVSTITATPYPSYACTGGAGELVYGWGMVGTTSNVLIFAQNFIEPINCINGVSIDLNPFTFQTDSYTS